MTCIYCIVSIDARGVPVHGWRGVVTDAPFREGVLAAAARAGPAVFTYGGTRYRMLHGDLYRLDANDPDDAMPRT